MSTLHYPPSPHTQTQTAASPPPQSSLFLLVSGPKTAKLIRDGPLKKTDAIPAASPPLGAALRRWLGVVGDRAREGVSERTVAAAAAAARES